MILAMLASPVLWAIYLALFIPLSIIGLVLLVPLCALDLIRFRPSQVWPAVGVDAWRGGWLTWLWGNEEDGVTGPAWWILRTIGPRPRWWNLAWSTYRWSALRNPVNNLRFVPVLCPVINPARVKFRKGDAWTFTWQGVYAGFIWFPVIRGQVYRFWLGWKLKPEDAQGVPDTDMRKPRCGFAIQFKRV